APSPSSTPRVIIGSSRIGATSRVESEQPDPSTQQATSRRREVTRPRLDMDAALFGTDPETGPGAGNRQVGIASVPGQTGRGVGPSHSGREHGESQEVRQGQQYLVGNADPRCLDQVLQRAGRS